MMIASGRVRLNQGEGMEDRSAPTALRIVRIWRDVMRWVALFAGPLYVLLKASIVPLMFKPGYLLTAMEFCCLAGRSHNRHTRQSCCFGRRAPQNRGAGAGSQFEICELCTSGHREGTGRDCREADIKLLPSDNSVIHNAPLTQKCKVKGMRRAGRRKVAAVVRVL